MINQTILDLKIEKTDLYKTLNYEEQQEILDIAKKTWKYFEDYLDFENGAARFSVRARGEGVIRLRVSGKSESVGEVRINSKAAFETYGIELSQKLTGVQAFWLFFEGADISVDAFSFHKAF